MDGTTDSTSRIAIYLAQMSRSGHSFLNLSNATKTRNELRIPLAFWWLRYSLLESDIGLI